MLFECTQLGEFGNWKKFLIGNFSRMIDVDRIQHILHRHCLLIGSDAMQDEFKCPISKSISINETATIVREPFSHQLYAQM